LDYGDYHKKRKVLTVLILRLIHDKILNGLYETLNNPLQMPFRHNHPSAGTTLFDGGIGVSSIESILGPKVYLEVVNRIVSPPQVSSNDAHFQPLSLLFLREVFLFIETLSHSRSKLLNLSTLLLA